MSSTNFFSEFQLSPRFSVGLMNRSLALKITAVEERDLGLYYCIANVNTRLTVGTGTTLQCKYAVYSMLVFPRMEGGHLEICPEATSK